MRHGYEGTKPPLSIRTAEHTTPARLRWIVPLPRTNEAKYVHTLPVIRTDKAHFVRQFNRTKYPCKGCYFN